MAHQRSGKQRRIPYPYNDSGDGRPSPTTSDTAHGHYMNSSVLRSLEIEIGSPLWEDRRRQAYFLERGRPQF